MVHIKDGNDLRTAYGILRDMQGLTPLPGKEEEAAEHIRQMKKDIREFLRHQGHKRPRRVIRDSGLDGFVELVGLPESLSTEEEAAAYFEEKEAIRCPGSSGGCTGLAYTCWYRIACRREGCGLTTASFMTCSKFH